MVSSVLAYDAFVCSRCGVCCRKQKVVLLTLFDIFRLARHQGMRPDIFFKKYCTKSSKFNSDGLRRFYLKADGGCPFLKENACSVHDVKPVVCARNPFYYPEASLASLKVFGILEDECHINGYPYDTVARGDDERLVDMDILVCVTDEYIARFGRFDEKTAEAYYNKSMEALNDKGLRSSTLAKLIDQSLLREETCRTDPYYKGAMGMYMSGFYDEFRRERKKAEGTGNAIVFEPSALGVIDGTMALVVFEKDYPAVKKALSQSQGADVRTKTLTYDGREYVLMSINGKNGGSGVITYYHTEPVEKKGLSGGPGEIVMLLKSEKGGSFIFKGIDVDGWLSHRTPILS